MENENVKKTNKQPIILAIIGILVVLLIAVGIVYKLRAGNPVTLTTAALERLGEGLDSDSNLGKLVTFMEDADALEASMNGKVTLPMDYGTIAFDMLLQEDPEAREAIMDLDLSINEETLYVEGQLDKDALYFAFKENADKYYYMTDLYYPEIDDIEYENVLDYVIESIEETVTKEDFKANEKEITVNGEKLNAKQYSLELNERLMAEISNKLISKISNDADLINAVAKMSDMTESEIRESLNDSKTSDEDLKELSEEAEVLYNIYVAKNKAVRYEIADVDDANNKLYIDNYKNVEIGFNSVDSYDEEMSISIKENKDEWSINVDSSNLKAVGTITDGKYDITVTAEGMDMVISGTEEYEFKSDSVKLVEKGNVKLTQDGASIEVPYEFTINYKDIDKVTLKNTTNKVDVNNMTTEQETEFSNELMQIPLIGSLMFTNTPEYDYSDEYYDDEIYDYSEDIYYDDYSYDYDYSEDYGYGY